MAESFACLITMLGNQFAYHIGRLLVSVTTLGLLSVESLPKQYPSSYVEAFDDNAIERASSPEQYALSHTVAIVIGYAVILSLFTLFLVTFRSYFAASTIPI